jgi:hypothetical protein
MVASALAFAPDGGGEEREEGDQRDVLHPERRVGPVDEVLEVGVGRAELDRPRRRIVLAGREHAALDVVHALAQAVHALAADPIVRCHPGLGLVHDAGATLEVVVDAPAGELVLPVVEHDAALGHGVAGVAIDLDAIGDQPRVAPRDLDVAGGHQQALGPDLLEPIGQHGHVTPHRRHDDRHLRGLGAGH